jgi:ribonuclease HI
MSDTNLLTIHTDGAARGNPGPAAFSFVISRPGQTDVEDGGCLGETTNNIAEYTALVKALQRARELGGRRLVVHSDSELMIKQMRGEYKVKHPGLLPLYEQAKGLVSDFDAVAFRHVRREQNKRADELCNLALDAACDGRKPAPKPLGDGHRSPAAKAPGSAKKAILPDPVREEALDCLRSVAVAWSYGNPNHPRPEEVWEQLWSILEEGGVLKTVRR